MPEFRVVKLQGSIFTPDLVISNSRKILNVVEDLEGDLLFGNPTMLPIPQDAPPEIPRFQFQSNDGKWILNVSLMRTDFIFIDPSPVGQAEVDDATFAARCGNFFSRYKEKLDLRAQRLAFVTERIVPDERAADFIIGKFCRDDLAREGKPFHNVSGFELHSLKKYAWENYRLNSWVRVKAADLKADKTLPCLFLLNDLNTPAFEDDPLRDFTTEEISRFFCEIHKHLKEILVKYDLE